MLKKILIVHLNTLSKKDINFQFVMLGDKHLLTTQNENLFHSIYKDKHQGRYYFQFSAI